MPNDVNNNTIEFSFKNMESIILAMKNEYIKRQKESHGTPDYGKFHNDMLRSLEVETNENDIPDNFKDYLLQNAEDKKAHEDLTARLREHLIEESTMLADQKGGFPHPVPRIRMAVRYYFTKMDDKEFLDRFDNIMYEEESKEEQILRHRAEGMTLEKAEELTNQERKETGLMRGKLIADMAKQFEKAQPKQLLNLTDEELVESFASLNYLSHISAEIGKILENDVDNGDQYIRFTPEERKLCEHLKDLWETTRTIQNRIKLISNPYYKYLDVNRFRDAASRYENINNELMLQFSQTSYIGQLASSVVYSPTTEVNKEVEAKEEVEEEKPILPRDKPINYLSDLGIRPDNVVSAVWGDTGKSADVFSDDILKLNDGVELKITTPNECIIIKKDEDEYSYKFAKETASIRFMDSVREHGIDPKKYVFTDKEGNPLQTEGEAWINYLAEGNPVTVTYEGTPIEITMLDYNTTKYKHPDKDLISHFEETVKKIGFQPQKTSYYKADGTKLDINSKEGKAYIIDGATVTVKCDITEAQIHMEEGTQITSRYELNPSAVRCLLHESLKAKSFKLDDTFFTRPDGKELKLYGYNEDDLKYISNGNPVIATCGKKQFQVICSPVEEPKFEATQYHKDNEELQKAGEDKIKLQDNKSSDVENVYTNTRQKALRNVVSTFEEADLVRLRLSGSRQFKQMKEQLGLYTRACRNLQQEDLTDPERRKNMELCTVKLLRSAREYLKYKGKNSEKHSEQLRINAAKTIELYAKRQLDLIDRITGTEKKLGDLDVRKAELQREIDEIMPQKLKQQKIDAQKKEAANVIPAGRQNKKPRRTYVQKLLTSDKLILRKNENLDAMRDWSIKQLDEKAGNVLDGFKINENGQKLKPDAKGMKVVEKLVTNLIIRNLVSIEQINASNLDSEKGPWEILTETTNVLKGLKRRIRDTDAFQLSMHNLSADNLKLFKEKNGETLNLLSQSVGLEIIMQVKNEKQPKEQTDKNITEKSGQVLGKG